MNNRFVSFISACAAGLLLGCTQTQTNHVIDQPIINTVVKPAVNTELTYVRTVEGIEEYKLSNGLKVLLLQDAAQPKTLVNITYRVGSVHEKYGETGMAHLLEHMLFKGSTNYPEIENEFKKRGMGINASTWLDRTNYFEVFETNDESLAWALGMEADRMVNATFTAEELKSEMTVVRNEMERGENNPIRTLLSRMSSMAHLWHNYGKSTIGARSDVENFPFEKLRAFYKTHYRPDNAVLTIAGRFDPEHVKTLVKEKFGVLAKPEAPIESLYTVEPTQDGERIVNLRRVGDVPWVGLLYHIPSGLHKDAAALRVLQQILADASRGRLKTDIVDTQLGTAAMAFSFMLKDSSQLYLFAQGSKDQDTKQLELELIKQAEHIKDKPITNDEVTRAQTTLLKQAEMALRDVQGVGMELSEYIAKGDYRHLFYFRDLVQAVTAADVQRVAEQYLIQSNRTLGRFIPTVEPKRADIPQPASLDELLKDYVGQEVAAAGEVYDNNVANITARLRQQTWAQGTELMVYPKKLRGEEIHLQMVFPTGSPKTLAGHVSAFSFLGSQVLSGNTQYTKAQIADKLDALKSNVSISSRLGEIYVGITTDKAHLQAVVKFVGELLSNPTFPAGELENAKRASISALEQQRNDPNAQALQLYREAMNAYPIGHPKAVQTIDEKIAGIQALTSADLAALYKAHITINQGYIAVVGDVNASALSVQLQEAIGHLTTPVEYQYMPAQLHDKQGLVLSKQTPDKSNANLYIINRLDINPKHPDYMALNIANSIFGQDTFSSRIGKRIRVEEGYSYSVRSGLSTSELDEHGVFWAMAIAAPENMPNVIQAYKEEVAKVVQNGFTQKELDLAIEGFVNSRKRAWAEDAAIPNVLIDSKRINKSLATYDAEIQAVQALTLTDIHNAFKQYIANKDINVFQAGDFK
ncbi:M16 family metallopeptidase [Algibacillus agarilyticus]|uniref:M16 family metallopeptidase n=1 Tax=Algibacillus agarilyticus TaxID=2234133 RepID=UPI000DCFE46D|nr:pitrilysin family protein [Algibacillus agarilyticus]